eukprot:5580286-Prymnesium_polylepis.1
MPHVTPCRLLRGCSSWRSRRRRLLACCDVGRRGGGKPRSSCSAATVDRVIARYSTRFTSARRANQCGTYC